MQSSDCHDAPIATLQAFSRNSERLVAVAVVGMLLVVLTGCGGAEQAPPEPKRDEAAERAKAEGQPVAEAAKAYFYPRHVEDYFSEMDSVSVPAQETSWPDQLIDRIAQPNNRHAGQHAATDPQNVSTDIGPAPESKTEVAQDGPAVSQGSSSVSGTFDDRFKAKPEVPKLSRNEILGRNTWMMWCAGNEGFWDHLANDTVAFIDLLKVVDSRERRVRFGTRGVINEPGMEQAKAPTPGEFGLWLDRPASPKVQKWRRAYLEKTFAQITKGLHKSQRGLSVYRGKQDKFANPVPYDDPGSYVRSANYKKRTSANHASGSYDHEENSDDYDLAYQDIPPPDIYGLSSGVIGLRLFPNPYFNAEAETRWDAERYYNDKEYYRDPKIVRPFRVGVACAYCHASFHPLEPPRDVNNPQWRNLSGSIGAQYLNIRAAFGNLLEPDDFVYHLLDSQPPGTIDTSLIASDNINNPNSMNAIFRLKERAVLSFRNPPELISTASKQQPALWRDPKSAAGEKDKDNVPAGLVQAFEKLDLAERVRDSNDSDKRYTSRVLFDGSDSIGAWGALARVYLNIGSYYEQWDQLHQPLVGFTPQRKFTIEDCTTHSANWNATQLRVAALRDYFLRVSPAMPLLSTPEARDRVRNPQQDIDQDGESRERLNGKEESEQTANALPLSISTSERARHVDVSKLARGRKAFANNCIVCHSSIQPETSQGIISASAELVEARKRVREEWNRKGEYWEHDPVQWLDRSDYQSWAESIVEEEKFWQQNFLSSDYRIPVNLVGTNSGRAMATNALTGHIWEDFASVSYRSLPSVGGIPYFDVIRGQETEYSPQHTVPKDFPAGGGGPGFYRVPSLVSIWSTAPLLHNNSLGLYNFNPSVNGRLDAFDDAIRKLLWPERRLTSSSYNEARAERLQADHGLVWRTPRDSYLIVGGKYVPALLEKVPAVRKLGQQFPWLQDVTPLWLPSVVLLATGFLLLAFSSPRHRRFWGSLWLVLGVLGLVAWYFAPAFSSYRWAQGFLHVKPIWLPLSVVLIAAIVMALPFSWKWTRYAGYTAISLSLVLGGLIYYTAGRLGDVRIGPIPEGTPVNLIANVNSEAGQGALTKAVLAAVSGLSEIESSHPTPKKQDEILREKVAPALLDVSKCPDFVMDRGHYFEWFKSMTDEDKDALIELLKTF